MFQLDGAEQQKWFRFPPEETELKQWSHPPFGRNCFTQAGRRSRRGSRAFASAREAAMHGYTRWRRPDARAIGMDSRYLLPNVASGVLKRRTLAALTNQLVALALRYPPPGLTAASLN